MVPEKIKAMKPEGYGSCTVTESGGRYYVMRTEHVWDADLGKNVTHHKSIGRIDPETGFVPNAYGKQLQEETTTDSSSPQTKPKETTSDQKPDHTANKAKSNAKSSTQKESQKQIPMGFADGYELMLQCAPDVAPAVREYLGNDAPQLLAITLMRLVEQRDTFELGGSVYEHSYASALFPDLDMSKKSVRKFLIHIGKREEDIQRFLHSRLTPGEKILIDGTPFFAEYVPDDNEMPSRVVHAAYAMDKESLFPEYYVYTDRKVMAPDLVGLAQEAGVTDGLAVLSSRSWTPDAPAQLARGGLRYVMQVRGHEDIQSGEWIREHGTEGFEMLEDDPEFGPIYGRFIPDPKTGGTIQIAIFSDTYEHVANGENLSDEDLYTLSLYTNLDVSAKELPNYLYYLPDRGFHFLALQQTLFSPWSGGMFGFAAKRKQDAQIEEINRGLALSDFLGLLYWQRADDVAARAKVPMELIDILRTARSDTVFDLTRHRAKSSSRARNHNFKLMGITHARNTVPDPWGDGKTP